MPRLFEILRAVPPERVAAMQATLRQIWPRFSYIDTFAAERARRAAWVDAAAPSATLEGLARIDAVSTLLGALAERRRKRQTRLHPSSAAVPSPASPGCQVVPHAEGQGGDEISRVGDDAGAVFEGREVGLTGWII